MSQQQRQRFEKQLRAGIQAAQQGNAERARELLESILRQDRNNQLGYNEFAWVWMASIVKSQKERRLCLQKVLEINPENAPAREAINSLVGVIGSTEKIDFAKIAASAKNPNDKKRTGPSLRQIMTILVSLAVVIGVLFVGSILIPPLFAPDPTATPSPTRVRAAGSPLPTNTRIPPTRTPSRPQITGVFVFDDRTPLPTDTPTITPTPTDTVTPTATLPPLTDYTVFFTTAVDPETSTSALYQSGADGMGLQRIADNIVDFDVNVAANRLVFTRPTLTTGEGEGTSSVEIIQAFVAPLNNPGAADQATRLQSGSVDAVSLSPDGTQLVYASTEDGDAELFLLNLQTGVSQKLTDNGFADTDPSWTADGSRIVFTSDRTSLGRNDIYFYNRTDGSQPVLLDTRELATSPFLSPDGSQLVFSDVRGSSSTVLITSADGSRSRQVRYQGTETLLSPVWSPDGLYVVFVARLANRADEIVFMAPGGEQELRIVFPDILLINSVIVQ